MTASAMLPRSEQREPAGPATHGGLSWLLSAVALVLAATAMASRYLFSDTLYDLYAGRLIMRHGIPHTNTVTVAAHGAAWVDQQWLAQVLYYGAWSAGGYRLLAALSAILVTSGFAVLAIVMLRRGVPPTRAFAWTLVAFVVCLGYTGIRAQSFAYPCIALTLWLITDDSRADRMRARTWLVLPVLVFWANTHGSVLLGAAMVTLYALYRSVLAIMRQDRRAVPAFALLAVLALASVACTPYGAGIAGYYARFPGNPPLSRFVAEWAPPTPLSSFSWAFFAVLVVIVVATFLAWRRGARPDPVLAGLAALTLALAFTAVRNQTWFGFAGTLLAADMAARASAGPSQALSKAFSRAVAGLLAALAVASMLVLATTPDSQFFRQAPRRPINVAADLAAMHPRLRVLGDDYSGTAMLWLRPAVTGRVAFDVRFELYGAELQAFCDFLFVRGHGWDRVTRGYGVVVASSVHPELVRKLRTLPGWRVVFEDSRGIVLIRSSAQRNVTGW